MFATALLSGVAFNALADDANQGSGKITFKGEVIDAPCSIAPGDEDQTINLGEVADTVLKKRSEITACRCHHSFAGLYFI